MSCGLWESYDTGQECQQADQLLTDVWHQPGEHLMQQHDMESKQPTNGSAERLVWQACLPALTAVVHGLWLVGDV